MARILATYAAILTILGVGLYLYRKRRLGKGYGPWNVLFRT